MKKRVMFLIESMIVGGAERVLLDLVNNLDQEKYDVTVLSVYKQSVYAGYNCQFADALNPEVHYHYLVDNSKTWKYRLFQVLFNRVSKRLLHRWLIGRSYDLEVAWYEGMPTTFLAYSSNPKSRKLAWLHYGDGFRNLSEAEREQTVRVYSGYDLILGVSDGVCRNFKERVCGSLPIQTCYNLIEDEQIRQKAELFPVERTDKTTFVTVGRLCQVKGYDRLLHVLKQLKEAGYDFRLWIVGDGGDRPQMEAYVAEAGLSERVQLFGNQTNPYPYIKAADWLVSSSYAEAFGMSILESIIIGTPIISTECLGTRELLGNDEYGLITENSEEGLLAGIKRVLDDLTLRTHYAEREQEQATRFTKQQLLNNIEKILDK